MRQQQKRQEGEMAPQQAGCPLVDDTAARLPAPDAPPCQVAPAQSSSLGLISKEFFFLDQKRTTNKSLSIFSKNYKQRIIHMCYGLK